MEAFANLVNTLVDFVWGPFLLIPLLLGVGVYLMLGLRFMPVRSLFHAFGHMWRGRRHGGDEGELSPFNALMTSMAATVGTGNIVGVATAIYIGGPGAVFWMWVTAVVGMATKYCEATLAVKYREVTPDGSYVGGPMYYIKNGLGKNWGWMAALFAIFGAVASFGIGNLTQCNAITANVLNATGLTDWRMELGGQVVPASWFVAALLFLVTGAVILGGVKRIGAVAGKLVPFMAIFYILFGIVVMIMYLDRVPHAFGLIFSHAFAPISAAGGFAGAILSETIKRGVSRGLFSNEAGLGSAPIAHATATTKNPVHQGFLGMLDPFLDTLVVCTVTALVILLSGEWMASAPAGMDPDAARQFLQGTLTARSFDTIIPGVGRFVVTVSLVLFAFSTVLGWSVYGERCAMYLFSHKASFPFRVIFVLAVPLGAVAKLDLVWALADLFNGLMALPNLVALALLSPVVFKLTKEYFDAENR
ncbi:Sodium/alanine symporter AgcS [uncultured delta proteobacterium]|uniref:Sodium/alanine symporter AgcS n=1 Tax=uncultured delta proteobacterium TaxID=34034 RepID=A0A212IVQ4_9DELT|nr:Sodium/alanine symporter AgcS [uncultured delta proteobacterium]